MNQISVVSVNVQNHASAANNILNASGRFELIGEATKEQSRAVEESGQTAEELSKMVERLVEFVN